VVTERECTNRHWWIKWGFAVLVPLLVGGLTAVGFTYQHADNVSSEAKDAANEACTSVQIHTATAVAESRAVRGRLDAMGVRQQRMEDKADRILETVIEIKRMNGGG